jgi:hypothetical protein
MIAFQRRSMSLLEKVTNLAVLATCVAVGGDALHRHFVESRAPSPYQVGERLKDTPGLALSRAGRTLIIMTASTCHFCDDSMPFMRKLTGLAEQVGTRVVGVSVEDQATNGAYLRGHGVSVDAVIPLKDNGLRAQPTPTLLLVRKDGTVISAWRGKLDNAGEQKVFSAIEGTV